jgi:Holliday junction resolvasome RuvABC endonuclease subunit
MLNIIGMDLSVRATGLCFRDGTAVVVKPKSQGDARFDEIAQRVMGFVRACDAHLAVIEKAPPGLKGHADLIYGVQAVIRTELVRAGIPYAEVDPNKLKKFATGNGSADKTAMAVAALKRAGLEFQDDNACDAWWLYQAGQVHYDPELALLVLPKDQTAALAGVVWPNVTAESVDAAKAAKLAERRAAAERLMFGLEAA